MDSRTEASQVFLSNHGWGDAERRFLAGDASDRTYDRLTLKGKTAVLMDAPPGAGDDPKSFVAIANHLGGIGLSPPTIFAQDLAQGFLLIEDLGDTLFARVLDHRPEEEGRLYAAATDVLVHLQAHPAPADLANLSAQDWAEAAGFALDWYAFAATGVRINKRPFTIALAEAISKHADGPRVLVLRDYHAENLIDLPDRSGVAAVGLLDFQLAQMGQPGYDLVSLVQDARRDVALPVAQEMTTRFVAATGCNHSEFDTSFAVLGAQRALRIIGIFARLCLVGGKPSYLRLIPRVWGNLQRNLSHPALAEVQAICAQTLPPPTPAVLQRIEDQCTAPSR